MRTSAPYEVADEDKNFEPKEGFRLIVTTQREEAPAYLADKLEAPASGVFGTRVGARLRRIVLTSEDTDAL